MTAPARTDHYAVPDPDAVEAVAALMRQVAEGTLTGTALAGRAAQRCREMFGQCDGPTDPLWPTHVEICRSVLGFGGLPAAELAQWLAVARNRESPDAATLHPPAPDAPLSEAHGHDSEVVEAEAEGEPKPVVPELDTLDATDALDALADIPHDVLAEAEAAARVVIDRYRRDASYR